MTRGELNILTRAALQTNQVDPGYLVDSTINVQQQLAYNTLCTDYLVTRLVYVSPSVPAATMTLKQSDMVGTYTGECNFLICVASTLPGKPWRNPPMKHLLYQDVMGNEQIDSGGSLLTGQPLQWGYDKNLTGAEWVVAPGTDVIYGFEFTWSVLPAAFVTDNSNVDTRFPTADQQAIAWLCAYNVMNIAQRYEVAAAFKKTTLDPQLAKLGEFLTRQRLMLGLERQDELNTRPLLTTMEPLK